MVPLVPAKAAAPAPRARLVRPTVARAAGFAARVAALVMARVAAPVAAVAGSVVQARVADLVMATVADPVVGALVALPMVADPVAMPADPIEAGIPTQARFLSDAAPAVPEHSVPLQTSCSSPSGRVAGHRTIQGPGPGSRSRSSGQTRPVPSL
jgi:hypothetical protein